MSGTSSALICVTLADTLSMLWLWFCRSGREAFGKRASHIFLELLCFVLCVSHSAHSICRPQAPPQSVASLAPSLTPQGSSPCLCPLQLLTLLHMTDRFWGLWEGGGWEEIHAVRTSGATKDKAAAFVLRACDSRSGDNVFPLPTLNAHP